MEEKEAKELYAYLQTILQFSFDLYVALDDSGLSAALDEKLKLHYERLRNVLHHAFPTESSFDELLKIELGFSLDAIPRPGNTSYVDVLMKAIEWADSQGYLLLLIAAASKRNPKNSKLRLFVMKSLKPLIEECISPSQEQAPAQPMPVSSLPPTATGNDGKVNGSSAKVRHDDGEVDGHNVDRIRRVDTAAIDANGLPPQDIGNVSDQRQPTPLLPRSVIEEMLLPPEEVLAQSEECIYIARTAIQSTRDQFQVAEQFDEDEVVDWVNEAKAQVEKILDIVTHISVLGYPNLRFDIEYERDYFHEKASLIVLSLQRQKNQSLPPRLLYTIQETVSELLESLYQAEKVLGEFRKQIEQSEQADDRLSGTDD